MNPRFSIIIPAFNAEATLGETLGSVAAQQFEDWECIVVDDGSADSTYSIAWGFAESDARFRVISQANQGTGGAYNTGVGAAQGEYVVICSADDVLLPDHLTAISNFIDTHTTFDIFSTNGFIRTESGKREPRYSETQEESSLNLADVISECFYSVGAAYRRSIFDDVGGYRTDVFGEDYDFWLRAMAAGARHRYVPAILSEHRLSSDQKSAQLERWWQSDIRIVTDLMESAPLSENDRSAAERLVRDRERRIARLHNRLRQAASRAIGRAIGPERAHRLLQSVRFAYSRKLRRS